MKSLHPDTQLQLDLFRQEEKPNRIIRCGDTRVRDSEGHYTTESDDDGSTEERLREQLYILRINCSIWLKNRDTEIAELKQKLKKYKNE